MYKAKFTRLLFEDRDKQMVEISYGGAGDKVWLGVNFDQYGDDDDAPAETVTFLLEEFRAFVAICQKILDEEFPTNG